MNIYFYTISGDTFLNFAKIKYIELKIDQNEFFGTSFNQKM